MRSKIRCIFAALCFLLLSPSLCFSQVIYNVSPQGTGVTSLGGAKSDIRSSGANTNSDVIVLLADGTYFLTEPLSFKEEDGGQSKYSVTYKAAVGANPVISGGKSVSGWEVDPVNPKLYRAKIDGVSSFRNLYVNGKRAQRARGTVVAGSSIREENGVKVGIAFNKDVIEKYNNPEHVEINYAKAWRDHYFLVEGIENLNISSYLVRIKNFDLIYKFGYNVISPGESAGSMSQFYFENALELLDQPDEWYYDPVSKYLYYYPFAEDDIETAEVIIPNIEQLVRIESSNVNVKVENLNFEGIHFAHNDWKWPSNNGFMSGQSSAVSGKDGTFKLPGAIHIDGGKNIKFKSNVFNQLGSSAINVDNNTDSVFIESNSFNDISASAVTVASWVHAIINPEQGEGLVNHTFISNNYVENIGVEFKGSPGIECFYTSNMIVDHNELYDMPYSGIAVGWGWSPALTTSKDIQITNNKITGVIQKCNDGGAIYSLSNFGGSGLLIEGNLIDEISLPSSTQNEGSIYTDEQSSNITIKNNVVKSSRKWYFHNVAGTISVDSMYVSSSTFNWGGNTGNNTNITLNANHVWLIPNSKADQIQANAGIVKGEEPPAIPTENIALNKPTYSSSNYDDGSVASKANDSNTASNWHSGLKDQAWWYIDLNDKYSLTSIEFVTQQAGTSYEETRRNFVIEASNDSTFTASETEILHTQGGTALSDRQTLRIFNPSINAYRYIRVRKTVLGEHMLIAELRVYGSLKSAPNVALNKPSVSSSNFDSGSDASKANDKSPSSFWHSGLKDKPWWSIDLNGAYSILSIEFVTQKSGTSYEETRRNFVIEASNDSTFPDTETEILHTQGSIALADRETLTLNSPSINSYRYIRVRKTVSGEHMLVAEFRVFGSLDTGPSIALNKPSVSSSNFDSGSDASKANDDSTSSFWHSGQKNKPWWYVDLKDYYSITSIEFVTQQSGTSYEETRRNFVIEASNSSTFPNTETEILHTQGGTPLSVHEILTIDSPTTNAYRYIRVRKTVLGEHMLVAELRVWGVKDMGTVMTTKMSPDIRIVEKDITIKAFPNPVRDKLTINIESEYNERIRLALFDIDGKRIKEFNHRISKGFNTLVLDVANVKSKMMILHAKSKNLNFSSKIVKEQF